ncbi:MAG: 3-phosphoshikimate 1-carboxyvinyltransferase [Planctomycetes bacterium]|jgi:3-phosphoshikimate 1-carboxyvinyltransferase|nr:3-phosphoshikimate 1-carboxyvinyltransferase [Planctomycetota bacterium]
MTRPPSTRTIHPSTIDGTIVAPPSKSVMLRLTAVALLAGDAESRIRNPTFCDDAAAGLRVAEGLGATIAAAPEEVRIRGGIAPRQRLLDCGESGLCLRMFAPIAALALGEIMLTGRGSLLRRPVAAVEEPLTALGARCRTLGGFPPVTVHGPLVGGETAVDGAVSSQLLTGLLLALPCARADSRLLVRDLASRPYVNLTLDILRRAGIRIENDGFERFVIPGGQRPRADAYTVEGDWSAAAFSFVLGAVGGRMRVTGLDPASAQADRLVLDVLAGAGARVVRAPDGAEVRRGPLRAFAFDVHDAPDLLPPLAALACHAEGTSVFSGTGRLRHKESDRAAALARELGGLGARVSLGRDALSITGGPVAGGTANSHGDHRVAMALAAAAVAARGPVVIEGATDVAKSWPRFFEDLSAAGGRVEDGVPRGEEADG